MKILELDKNNSNKLLLTQSQITSKGNQVKYTSGSIWIKLNDFGYENLAEYYASELLKCSNVNNFVEYKLCRFNNKDGCYSENMLGNGEVIKTFSKIMKLYGVSQTDIDNINSLDHRIKKVVAIIKEHTTLDVTEYLSNILALDAVILNEDRHFQNLCLIYNTITDTYRECPIFDNGLSFLSDTSDYQESTSALVNMRRVKAKPFSTSFKKQVKVLNPTIRFDKEQVEKAFSNAPERIKKVIYYSMSNYPELFVTAKGLKGKDKVMESYVLEFDILCKDKKVGYVKSDSKARIFIAESYSDVLGEMPWIKGAKVDFGYVIDWLGNRVFPETRTNCDELLDSLGMDLYSPVTICRKTHAATFDDDIWIRFKGEELTYNDVRKRK